MGAVKAMFSFFTMLRLDIGEEDMAAMDRSFHLLPVIGLFYGLLAFISIGLLLSVFEPLIAATLTLFLVSLMNRFLHLDGTMDTGDGLVVSGGREDHLRALKDSRIGAGGVAFAVFVILLAVASWSALAAAGLAALVLMGEVFSRNAAVATAAFGSPGSGMAGESVRLTTLRSLATSTTLSALLSAPVLAVLTLYGGWTPEAAAAVLVLMAAVSAASGWVMAKVAEGNFGMVNGDVLGATNEISRPLLALASLAVMTWMFL